MDSQVLKRPKELEQENRGHKLLANMTPGKLV